MIAAVSGRDWFAVYADAQGVHWAVPLVGWFMREPFAVDGPQLLPMVSVVPDGGGQCRALVAVDCIAVLHREELPSGVEVRRWKVAELRELAAAAFETEAAG